jgi:hypothetical protein
MQRQKEYEPLVKETINKILVQNGRPPLEPQLIYLSPTDVVPTDTGSTIDFCIHYKKRFFGFITVVTTKGSTNYDFTLRC